MKRCPKCNTQFEDGKFCLECGTPLVDDIPAAAAGMSLNFGDANAISGGVHLSESHSVINNFTQERQKTEFELSQERKMQFMTLCKEVFADGIVEDWKVASLEAKRVELGIDTNLATQLIELVKNAMPKRMTTLSKKDEVTMMLIFDLIEKNQEELVDAQLPRLQTLTKYYQVDEVRCAYNMIMAALHPVELLQQFERETGDDYWQTFWASVAFLKMGKVAKSEETSAKLSFFRNYPENNGLLLSALSINHDFGAERAKRALGILDERSCSPELKPFFIALCLKIDPERAVRLGADEQAYQFYLEYIVSLESPQARAERLAREQMEAQRLAMEAEKRRKEAEEAERKRIEEEKRREEEERKRIEEEKRRLEEERIRKEEEERRRIEAEKKRIEEEKRRQEEERRRKEEEKKRQEEERRRKEEERKRQEEERKRKEEERKREEEERRRKEEKRKLEEAERKRQEEEKRQKEAVIAQRKKEAEIVRRGYMNIQKVDFANGHKSGDLITDFGADLVDTDMRSLYSRITYDSLLDQDKTIVLNVKIIGPDRTVQQGNDSPEGYSFSDLVTIEKGEGQMVYLMGWRSSNRNAYKCGTYRYELWYENNLIYTTNFTIKSKNPSAKVLKVTAEQLSRGGTKIEKLEVRFIIHTFSLKQIPLKVVFGCVEEGLKLTKKASSSIQRKTITPTSDDETIEVMFEQDIYGALKKNLTYTASIAVINESTGKTLDLGVMKSYVELEGVLDLHSISIYQIEITRMNRIMSTGPAEYSVTSIINQNMKKK